MNPQKTNGGNLISSFACSPEKAADDFLLFRQAYQMNTGRSPQNEVIAYHVRQAFKPGEVTPEKQTKSEGNWQKRSQAIITLSLWPPISINPMCTIT